MTAISLLLIALAVQLCASLHLHHAAQFNYSARTYDKFVDDNLAGSNLNYYFGALPVSDYYAWRDANKDASQLFQCPATNPYAIYEADSKTFKQCIACDALSSNVDVKTAKVLFNLETRECEVCTSPGKTLLCSDLLKRTALEQQNSSFVEIQSNATVSNSSSASSLSFFDLCPPQTPLYNPKIKLCENCPALQEFDGPTQTCIPIIFTSNLQAANILMPSANSLDQQQYTIQKTNPSRLIQQCPQEKPYLQGNSCISCKSGWLFNHISQQCLEKCPEGTFYNQKTYSCSKGAYYSDVAAANLVSQLQTYNSWKASIDNLSQNSAKMIKCGPQTPYAVSGVCISCSGETPLFNIDLNICVGCTKGRSYNAEKRRCLGSYDSSGSLRRVIANIS